jgi:hypothetical protein
MLESNRVTPAPQQRPGVWPRPEEVIDMDHDTRPPDEVPDVEALPTAEEIAGPIVAAIYRLHDMHDWIEQLACRPDMVPAVVDLFAEVGSLIEATVNGTTVGGDGWSWGAEVRRILCAIAGADELAHAFWHERSAKLAYGPPSTASPRSPAR